LGKRRRGQTTEEEGEFWPDLGNQWRPNQGHIGQQREAKLRPHTTDFRWLIFQGQKSGAEKALLKKKIEFAWLFLLSE
jgi:hypothetical protein